MTFIELLQVRILTAEIKCLTDEQRAELDHQLYPIKFLVPLPEEEQMARDAWIPGPWDRLPKNADGTIEPLVMNRFQYDQGFAPPTTQPATWCELCKKWDCFIPVVNGDTSWHNHQGMLHPHPWPPPDPASMANWCSLCETWGCKMDTPEELARYHFLLGPNPPLPVKP